MCRPDKAAHLFILIARGTMRQGDVIHQWVLIRVLGRGGSSQVWAARDGAGREIALKIQKSYVERFREEIKLYRRLGDRPGILPLIDWHLPDRADRSAGPAWIAMEIGTPITAYLGAAPSLVDVVEAIKSYAKTLTTLAAERIHHRDIKPGNLYWAKNEYVLGDFGIADFPDKAGLTVEGKKVGPANYLAPEMIEYSGDTESGPADVYSLAKTLWAIAAGRTYPPPGELRRDRPELQLRMHVEDRRAFMLEALLERATAHNPSMRPTMRGFAEELRWWGETEVASDIDLSGYAAEVERLRQATAIVRSETDQERRERLYNEAINRTYEHLDRPLRSVVESTGMRPVGSGPRTIEGWPPVNYGGTANLPCWGIETLSSPWLAACIGLVHRAQPKDDLDDLMVTVLLAQMTPDSQHNYIESFERVRPDSLVLDRVIEQLKDQMGRELPAIIAHFLASCREAGVPRGR